MLILFYKFLFSHTSKFHRKIFCGGAILIFPQILDLMITDFKRRLHNREKNIFMNLLIFWICSTVAQLQ